MATCPSCRAHYDDGVARCPNDGESLLPDEAFASADRDLAAGDVVGEYKIEGKLGEGGFGTVYRAVHPLIGKKCALKTLHRQFSSNPQMVSRFIAEARAVNQIRHRNIIDIFSFGALPDGRQYYLMELLDGLTFDAYLEREGRVPPERAIAILRPIARALDAAHAAGIAHRDLKPENIFLTFDEDGTPIPKLLDFGIAKLLTDGISGHKTRTGAPMGTPNYMSPEQCRGANVDHRTDIYAFGILCHQILTGKLPFDADTVMDLLVKHMNSPPPAVSEVCPDLGTEFDAPVAHMLAKDAGARPQTVGAAFEELASAARRAGHSVSGGAGIGNTSGASSGPGPMTAARSSTPSQLGVAATMAAPAASKTFLPAASDLPRPLRGNRPLVIGGALCGVVLTAVLVRVNFVSKHPLVREAASATSVATLSSTAPPPGSSSAAGGVTVVAPPPRPTSVNVTFPAAPPHAAVFCDGTRIGEAPGPVGLPAGSAPVTLTLKAPGYQSLDVPVVPSQDVTSPAKMKKIAPGGHGSVNKDLEPSGL